MRQGYRMVSAPWLHASYAHLAGNLVVLLALGNKLERQLGSVPFAALVAALIPIVGTMHVSATVVVNFLARKFGTFVSNMGVSNMLRGYFHDAYTFLQDIVDRQTGMDTTSIGFSGLLFALNTISSLALEPQNVYYGFKLSSLPASVQRGIMRTLGLQRNDSIMTRTLYIPARMWPLVQVALSQLTDPRAVSFSGSHVYSHSHVAAP
jgi:membrane associated rhomboid family serine protease